MQPQLGGSTLQLVRNPILQWVNTPQSGANPTAEKSEQNARRIWAFTPQN